MPTPIFAFRLPDAQRKTLQELSKLYGSVNPSEFCREMLGAICSRDPDRVNAFVGKLAGVMQQQMTLELVSSVERKARGLLVARGKSRRSGKGARKRGKPRK